MYVAGDSGSESLDDYRRPGDSTFFGGTYPAQTWAEYMQVATDDQPVRAFDPPAYVNADAAPQPSPSYTQQPTEQPSATQEPTQEPTRGALRGAERRAQRRAVHPGAGAERGAQPVRRGRAGAGAEPERQHRRGRRRERRRGERGRGRHPGRRRLSVASAVPVDRPPARPPAPDVPSRSDPFVAGAQPPGRRAARRARPAAALVEPGPGRPRRRHAGLPGRDGLPAALPDHRRRPVHRAVPRPLLLRHRPALQRPRPAAGQRPLPRLRRLPGAGVPRPHRLVPRARAPGHGPPGRPAAAPG